MHKKHQKSNKVRAHFYAKLRHDLFYITVKFHQNIPNDIQVIEQTQKCLWTD